MSSPDRLPRTLGLGSATALVIGITIGSGIFRSPAGVAQRVGDPMWFLGLWVVGGLLALAGALSLAELAAAFPESGGYYAYLRESWGRPVAFLFGWTQLVLLRASAIGGIALACGEYTLRMIGVDPSAHSLLAELVSASAIVIAASANIVGARIGAVIVNASSSAKFVALVAPRRRGAVPGRRSRCVDRELHDNGTRDSERLRARAGQRPVGLRRIRRRVVRRR